MKKKLLSISLIVFFAFISLMTGCDTCDEVEDSTATIFSEGVVGFFYNPGMSWYDFDLDTGTWAYDETPDSDFELDLNPGDRENLYPKNGATFCKLGNVSFDSITYSDLESYTYSLNGFQLHDEEWDITFEGYVVIAAKTSTGRYSKFFFYENARNATIHWVTFNFQ